jgi:phosphoglycolate phosphatase
MPVSNIQRYSAILFDLDGTLTDPYRGITGSIRHALRCMNVDAPDGDLGWCIGPPLGESLAHLLGTDDPASIDRGIAHYRERYAELGILEQELYPCVPEMLGHLHNATRSTLILATSKPRVYAEKILAHFGIAGHFDACYGAELDGTRSRKDELIAHLLERESLDPARTVMVGDRRHDVIGARSNGVNAIGVTYGYGSAQELAEAGATHICGDVEALRDLLSKLGTGRAHVTTAPPRTMRE